MPPCGPQGSTVRGQAARIAFATCLSRLSPEACLWKGRPHTQHGPPPLRRIANMLPTLQRQRCLAAPLPQTARHRRSKSIDGKAAAKMCTHYPRGPESAVMDARVLETSTRGLNPLDDVVKVADCISTLQRDKRSTAWLQRLRVLNDAIVDPPASCC